MTTKNKNLLIWEQVEKTDPKFTKEAKIGGRTMTTINAMYQIEQATAIFGPYGLGFGISEISFVEKEYKNETHLIAHATFFYVLEEKRYSFPISSAIKMIYVSSNNRVIIDVDAYKKLETDIVTKAFSKLGFSADVFKGRYDDNRYVNDIIEEFKDKNNADFQDKEIAQLVENLEKDIVKIEEKEIAKITKNIQEAQSLDALMNIYNNLGNLANDLKIKALLSERKQQIYQVN